MAEDHKGGQTATQAEALMDEPVPAPEDPGGAHAKGYSAEPGPLPHVAGDGPLPLAPAAPNGIHVPENDIHVRPTGRGDEGGPAPGERVVSGGR